MENKPTEEIYWTDRIWKRKGAFLVLFIFSIITCLSLLVTVIKTKSVRNQLIRILLINMALGLFVFTLSILGTLGEFTDNWNWEEVTCHSYLIVSMVSTLVFHAVIVLLGLDAIFG